MNKPLELFERTNLKNELKWGDIGKISELAGVNRITVERYFEGESDNLMVQKCAVQLVEARKEKLANKLKDIV